MSGGEDGKDVGECGFNPLGLKFAEPVRSKTPSIA